jgi:uncharacterized protein
VTAGAATGPLRPARLADVVDLCALNNAHVPEVSPATADTFRWFLEHASVSVVDAATPRGTDRLDGLLVLVEWPGSTYWSRNFAWFAQRFDRFLYVDRIVVAERRWGEGLGRAFYGSVVAGARQAGIPLVCAEVNLRPPNERSLRFHRAQGFEAVGEHVDAEGKSLAMLALPVQAGTNGH